MKKLDVHITQGRAKVQMIKFVWVQRVFMVSSVLLGIVGIVSQNAWDVALFLIVIASIVSLGLQPHVRTYKKLIAHDGPVFTVTESGIIHHLKDPDRLIKWEEIKEIGLRAGGVYSGVRLFKVVMKGRSWFTAMIETIWMHPFQYSDSDLCLLTNGKKSYAAVAHIEKYIKKHAPPEINKF